MSGEEYEALVADIKKNGLLGVIVLHEGMILDGRHRYRACLEAGVEPHFVDYLSTSHGQRFNDPAACVLSANIHRRHLDAEGKRDAILKFADWSKSDRAIAAEMKSNKNTIGRLRKKAEQKATVPVGTVKKRTGKDGKARKQPATKPPTIEPEDNKPREPRKLTKQQQERQDHDRREREKADRVVVVLMERLDRDDLTLLYAAIDAVGGKALWDAIKERAGINIDAVINWMGGAEVLFENAEHCDDFFGNLRKAEIELREARNVPLAGNANASDPEISAEAMKAKFAAIEEPLASNGGAA
jgi:ParB-like chromosome segregation protein Spo0J